MPKAPVHMEKLYTCELRNVRCNYMQSGADFDANVHVYTVWDDGLRSRSVKK